MCILNVALDRIWAKRLKGTVPINFSDSPTNAMHANKISAKNNFEITIYILINSRKIKKITVLMNHNLSLKSWFPYFFTLFTCEKNKYKSTFLCQNLSVKNKVKL